VPKGKTQRSRDLIDACYAILQEMQPATVRAVCYQLFIRQLLPSMAKTCTNRVSTQLVYARQEGIIPWAWIVDETREAERQGTWANPETFIPVVMRSYRRDRWELQPRRVEVWSEKGTIRGTLAPVLVRYGVTFRVMHGHGSATALHDAAEESQEDTDSPRIILYCGDYDPSGMHMSAVDAPERLARYGGNAVVLRVALAGDDVDPRRSLLPSFPASDKKKDTRYKWFVKNYGETCWELDALSPVVLRDRMTAAIEEYIDWDAWLRCEAVEAAEQRSLRQILGTWRTVISGQASI
jgi:hypothetical protein